MRFTVKGLEDLGFKGLGIDYVFLFFIVSDGPVMAVFRARRAFTVEGFEFSASLPQANMEAEKGPCKEE